MSDRWVLAHDPRDGEHPETDNCPHGIDQNEAGCGRCIDTVEPWGSRTEMTEAEMTEAFAAFFRQKLDQITRTEDEQMGAHFAARFNGEGK